MAQQVCQSVTKNYCEIPAMFQELLIELHLMDFRGGVHNGSEESVTPEGREAVP